MLPVFLAHGPNLFVAIPVAVLWLLCLYGSPAAAWWLARRSRKRTALGVSAIGIALGVYATVAEFPGESSDALLWLAIGPLPLVAASVAFLMALRIKSVTDETA